MFYDNQIIMIQKHKIKYFISLERKKIIKHQEKNTT